MKFQLQLRKKFGLADLGQLSGRQYMLQGASLMALKYGLDSLVSGFLFHRAWSFEQYFLPILTAGATSTADVWFYAGMLLVALPFAFIGSLLTIRRLNTIGLPLWMVILFYMPFLNMIFFVILSIVESPPIMGTKKSTEALDTVELIPPPAPGTVTHSRAMPLIVDPNLPARPTAVRWINKLPVEGKRAFVVAALLPVPISVLAAFFSVILLGVYGWNVFTAVPFVAAISAPILFGWQRPRRLKECLLVSITCLMLMSSMLLLIPFEGIICLLMASPLAVGVGLIGGFVGYLIQANMPRDENVPKLLGCFAAIIPLLAIGEYAAPASYPLYENASTIVISAPAHVVWKYLIDFPPLDPPTELVFKTGIAYPIEARIKGRGPGAIRECIFTTGKFIEPIEIWNEPKLLRFGVLEQPPPMHELSPYPDLHPPHLNQYLTARRGQFLLTPIDSTHTLLQGTTWYQNYMSPCCYWRLWSDWIIHSIHMRVLNHVKHLSETNWTHSIRDSQ